MQFAHVLRLSFSQQILIALALSNSVQPKMQENGLRFLKSKVSDLIEMHNQKRAAATVPAPAATTTTRKSGDAEELKAGGSSVRVKSKPIPFERLSDSALHELILCLRTSELLPASLKADGLSSLQSVYPDMYASLLLSPLVSTKPAVAFMYLPRKYVSFSLARLRVTW